MEIKVLGTGCARCVKTYEAVKKAIELAGANATIEKVEDIMEIMKYDIMATPAVVIDGEVKIRGRVPSEQEIIELIKQP